jgi:hypothetical protein
VSTGTGPLKTLEEHGRKFFVAMLAVVFQIVVIVSTYAKALVGSLANLDLVYIAGAAAGVAGLAGLYAGANAWAKQAEARIYESNTRVEDLDLADD